MPLLLFQLLEAVNNLPDSHIYLIESSNRNTKSLGKVRYLVDSAVIEALVVMLINATKGKPMKRTKREKDSEDHYRDHSFDSFGAESDIRTRSFHHDEDFDMRTRSETDFLYELTNKVYVFHKKNFQQWSTIKGERISSYPFVTELIKEGTGPLAGLEIPHYFHHEILQLSNLQEKEGLARSLLMADLVVRFCSDLSVEEEEETEEKNKTVNREKGS